MTTERQTVPNPIGSPKLAPLPRPDTSPPTGSPPTPEQAASEQLARQSFYLNHLQPEELGDWHKAMRLDAAEEVALLRCLTRRALEFGDPREVSNLVRLTLAALKLQVDLSHQSDESELDRVLAGVLAELNGETSPDQLAPSPLPGNAPPPPRPPRTGTPALPDPGDPDEPDEPAETHRWLTAGLGDFDADADADAEVGSDLDADVYLALDALPLDPEPADPPAERDPGINPRAEVAKPPEGG